MMSLHFINILNDFYSWCEIFVIYLRVRVKLMNESMFKLSLMNWLAFFEPYIYSVNENKMLI